MIRKTVLGALLAAAIPAVALADVPQTTQSPAIAASDSEVDAQIQRIEKRLKTVNRLLSKRGQGHLSDDQRVKWEQRVPAPYNDLYSPTLYISSTSIGQSTFSPFASALTILPSDRRARLLRERAQLVQLLAAYKAMLQD